MGDHIHILCVLNPVSGNGLGKQLWPKAAALMERIGISHEVLTVDDRPLPEALLRHFQQKDISGYNAICGMGGDGTHSQIINGLMRYQAQNPGCRLPPYAMIPLGTGNDIAKSFGLTARENLFVSDLSRAVATIRYGADYLLDIGRMGDLYFVDALTVGLDSHVLAEHNRRKAEMAKYPFLSRIVRGDFLYTCCLGLKFWRHASIQAAINVDGKEWYRGPVVNLIVNNTRVYGGEFVICPDSFANDGLFEVVVFAGHYDYLARYMLSLRGNPREIRKMAEKLGTVSSHTQGRRINISLSRRESAQYDGEMLSSGDKFEIEVVPHAIRLKVPAEPA
jgi:YegS/Rv2252/BmrU family lipid kinase